MNEHSKNFIETFRTIGMDRITKLLKNSILSWKKVNEKYKNDKFDDDFSTKRGQQYVKEIDDIWQKEYRKALIEDFGPDPITKGMDWVERAPLLNEYSQYIKK